MPINEARPTDNTHFVPERSESAPSGGTYEAGYLRGRREGFSAGFEAAQAVADGGPIPEGAPENFAERARVLRELAGRLDAARFGSRRRFSSGYCPEQVDAAIAKLSAAFKAGRTTYGAPSLMLVRFLNVGGGYDMLDVDHLLDDVAARLDELGMDSGTSLG